MAWLMSYATMKVFLANQIRQLQSLMNSGAWLILNTRKISHASALFWDFHWLLATEHVAFRLTVLAYSYFHGLAPACLSAELRRVAEISARSCMRSVLPAALQISRTRLSVVDDELFAVAAVHFGNNCLPCVAAATPIEFQETSEPFFHLFFARFVNCFSFFPLCCDN
jgi:hypothetical protein